MDNNVVDDDPPTQNSSANADLVLRYFLDNWGGTEITRQNLDKALDQMRPYLKFYEPDQVEFNGIYNALSAQEKAAFGEWKGTRGLTDTFRNAVALVSWIKAHGFKVTHANLQPAIGQSRVAPFLEWDNLAHRVMRMLDSINRTANLFLAGT